MTYISGTEPKLIIPFIPNNSLGMVLVPAQTKILVTGASGFIGAQAVEAFLRRDFSVRGTALSASKGKYLDNLFESKGFKSLGNGLL